MLASMHIKMFKAAWRMYDTVDPNCIECEIMSMICDMDPDALYYDGSKIAEFVRGQIDVSAAAGPLVWVLEYHPRIFRDISGLLIFWRWALQDGITLLAAMKQYQITREQLMDWYDAYDAKIKQHDEYVAMGLVMPGKDDLDLEWITALLFKKSAHSG